MRVSRRKFLRTATSSGVFSYLPHHSWPVSPDDLQARLAADRLRPQFHLLPARNWMNDPNGPIYWQGAYHMFYQHNPNAAVWGAMHWAHAVSEDMIHWRHLPIALAPTPGWDDADGCFTGSAVDDHGTATILYTGVKSSSIERATLRDGHNNFRELQCLATSTDPQLRTWTKWKQPVIEPPNDPTLAGFRDPFLWHLEDHWILGVASGHFKKGGCVLLYRSKDLRNWEPLHELTSGHWTEKESINPVDSGEMWECPDFFPLGKKHVLLYSTAGSVLWESGEFDSKELKFHSDRRGFLDHGAYYAQKTQLDAHGNRILWGWIPEKRPDSELIAAGWAGCMSLPRVLSLDVNGNLEMRIAAQAHSLRAVAHTIPGRNSSAHDRANALGVIRLENLSAELDWRVLLPDCVVGEPPPFQLSLDDALGPWWSIRVEHASNYFTVNDKRVDLKDGLGATYTGDTHAFHLLIDGSVAELLIDHEHALTTRIYRQPQGPFSIRATAEDLASILDLTAWQLKPISRDRLTS